MAEPFATALQKIVTSQHLGHSLDRAHRLALDQRHGMVTLEHLLFALTEDVDAGIVLSASKVDIERLRGDISGFLGRQSEQPPAAGDGTVRPNADLLRILQAAAAAARQSSRKHIDGAIVLAAMVGDANTPAAGLLKAHGLTFEEAIKALQHANAETKPKVTAPSPATMTPGSAAPATPGAPLLPVAPPARVVEAAASRPQKAGASTEELLASVRARIQEQEPPVPQRPQVRVIPKRASQARPVAAAAPAPDAAHETPHAPTEAPFAVAPPAHVGMPLTRDRVAGTHAFAPHMTPAPSRGEGSVESQSLASTESIDDRQYGEVGADAGEPEFRIDPRPEPRHAAGYDGLNDLASEPPAAVRGLQPVPQMPKHGAPIGPDAARRTPPPLPAPPLMNAPNGVPPLRVPEQLGARSLPPPLSRVPAPAAAPVPRPEDLALYSAPALQPSNGSQSRGAWPHDNAPNSGAPSMQGALSMQGQGRDAGFGGPSFPRLGDRLLARPDLMRAPAEDAIAPVALNIRQLADRFPKSLPVWRSGQAPITVEIAVPRAELPSAGRAVAVTLRLASRDAAIAIAPLTPETQWLSASPNASAGDTLTWRWSVTALQAGPSGIALALTRTVQADDGRWLASAPQEHKFGVNVAGEKIRKARGWGRRIVLVCLGTIVGAAVGAAVWTFLPQLRAVAGL